MVMVYWRTAAERCKWTQRAFTLFPSCVSPCRTQTNVSGYSLSTAGSSILKPSCTALTDIQRCIRGLKYVAKHRTQRIAAIANSLAGSDYDIIALQELWVFADYEHVRASVSSHLPYSKFFYRCDASPSPSSKSTSPNAQLTAERSEQVSLYCPNTLSLRRQYIHTP